MMILYSCEGSRGLRASWTAAELGLALDYRMMALPPRVFDPEYLDENPLGTVPMLVDGEIRLTESSAISHYLAAKAEPNGLIVRPEEQGFGAFLDFMHHADATLTFPQTVYLRFAVFERDRGLAEAGEVYARWFGARLVKLENRLKGRAFLSANRFTTADIAVCYALWLSQMLGLDRFFGPNVASYLERQTQRPAFQLALDRERAAAKGIAPSLWDHLGEWKSSTRTKNK